MKLLGNFHEIFWDATFWLPPNTTWKDFEKINGSGRISTVNDLIFAWKLVPLLLILKYTFEKYVGAKLANWAGLEEKLREKPPTVMLLKRAYRESRGREWRERDVLAFSKQLNWSAQEVRQWFRAKQIFESTPITDKIGESSWRFVFFTCIFSYGLWAHWTKDWFWNFKLCWENFPQPVSEELYWYFIISFANYSSWGVSHFWDVQRKDPKIMMFHHFVALTLLSTQWMQRYHRIGLLICWYHDIGDLQLELSKVLKYLKFKTACRWTFFLFTFVWILVRNIIFPFYLVTSIYNYSPHNVPLHFPFSCLHGSCSISSFQFTATHVLLLCCWALCLLHVYWTYLILRVLYLNLAFGIEEDDTVSDCEEEEHLKKKM
ncbi:unnamed protein product [Bemisia tabaci]|uniref:TLC domain-containing protein n=1 Tax=Bemisia tabaci TaxID=7038 RepID=A0A9P0AAH8_BEMTA|nr:unnamed protein product [Bemisia tabaci]